MFCWFGYYNLRFLLSPNKVNAVVVSLEISNTVYSIKVSHRNLENQSQRLSHLSEKFVPLVEYTEFEWRFFYIFNCKYVIFVLISILNFNLFETKRLFVSLRALFKLCTTR